MVQTLWAFHSQFGQLNFYLLYFLFSSVHSLSHVHLFETPWIATFQASLSIINCQSLLKLMSIKSMMLSRYLILYRPLLLLPSISPSIRVFSNESVFAPAGQSIRTSASASVFPMNIQDWFPFRLTISSWEVQTLNSNYSPQWFEHQLGYRNKIVWFILYTQRHSSRGDTGISSKDYWFPCPYTWTVHSLLLQYQAVSFCLSEKLCFPLCWLLPMWPLERSSFLIRIVINYHIKMRGLNEVMDLIAKLLTWCLKWHQFFISIDVLFIWDHVPFGSLY